MKPALTSSGAIITALARFMFCCSQVISGSRMKLLRDLFAALTRFCCSVCANATLLVATNMDTSIQRAAWEMRFLIIGFSVRVSSACTCIISLAGSFRRPLERSCYSHFSAARIPRIRCRWMRYSCRDCSSSGLSRCISCFRRSRSDSHRYIAVLEGLHFTTGRAVYLRLSKFWLKVFAVSFGMGVVSGIVMPFQFGTNWSRFSDLTADIVGPLMAYEGLTAFFLEAGFLGVLLFGRNRAPRGCILRPRSWSRPGRCSRRSGSSSSTAGCRHPTGHSDGRRAVLPGGLDRRHLQSVFSVPLRAHRHGVLYHDGVRRRRRGRVPLACAAASAKKARPC